MNALSTPAASGATSAPAAPDLAAVKGRQQATWASGDYHMIGTQIQIVSELLIEALDVHSTEHILDVATGSGNAALAAARRGCQVVGVDYVPSLLDRARRRRELGGASGHAVPRASVPNERTTKILEQRRRRPTWILDRGWLVRRALLAAAVACGPEMSSRDEEKSVLKSNGMAHR
jgi:SAM-dependent methyltransferase